MQVLHMQHVEHLTKNRFGIYCFRWTFPKRFHKLLNEKPKTIWLSLKTREKAVAICRTQLIWLRLNAQLSRKGGGALSEKDIKGALRAYRDYISEAETYEQDAVYWGQPAFDEIYNHVYEQLSLIDHHQLLPYLDTDDFSNLDSLHRKAVHITETLTQRALDKQIEERLGTAEVTAGSIDDGVGQVAGQELTDAKLSDVLDVYIAQLEEAGDLKAKYKDKETAHFRLLIEVVGDKSVATFSKADVGQFRDALLTKQVKRYGGKVDLSATTKNEYIRSCARIFDIAKSRFNGVSENFFRDSSLQFKKPKKGKAERKPFTDDELKRLFGQPVFTKGAFAHPYQYWIPLLALYTGARANELCQLHITDLVLIDGISCLDINEDTPDKSVKSRKSRKVPLHPHLIDLGFVKFVELLKKPKYRWKDEHGYARIFRGLARDQKNGGYTKNLSRWFNGTTANKLNGNLSLKHAAGIEADHEKRRDFHSFRHTCSTALDNAGVPSNIGFWITGHAYSTETRAELNTAGHRYRHGISVKVMHDHLSKLDFHHALSKVQPFFDICDEKRLRNKTPPRT